MAKIIDMTARRQKQLADEAAQDAAQDALTSKAVDLIAKAMAGLMAGTDSPEQARQKLLEARRKLKEEG